MIREQFEHGYHPSEEEIKRPIIGPEGELLWAIFGEGPFSIPWEFAQIRKAAVAHAVSTLTAREQIVIGLRLGFSDEKKHTLKEIGQIIGSGYGQPIKAERVRQVEAQALRKLRHPSRSCDLRLFLPCLEGSIGRTVWGIGYAIELANRFPEVEIARIGLHDLDFSEEAIRELKEAKIAGNYYFSDFLRQTPARPFSPSTFAEISQSLDKLRENKTQEDQSPNIAKEEGSLPKNNLLPEIPLTNEQLRYLRGLEIRELDLFVRAQNALKYHNLSNIGEILALTRKELTKIRNFGYKGALALGEKLEDLLSLPESERGSIKNLVTSEFPGHTSRESSKASLANTQIKIIRGLASEAAGQGFTSPEEIQGWLKAQGKTSIFGVRTGSWIAQAMIEWAINHPEEGKKD